MGGFRAGAGGTLRVGDPLAAIDDGRAGGGGATFPVCDEAIGGFRGGGVGAGELPLAGGAGGIALAATDGVDTAGDALRAGGTGRAGGVGADTAGDGVRAGGGGARAGGTGGEAVRPRGCNRDGTAGAVGWAGELREGSNGAALAGGVGATCDGVASLGGPRVGGGGALGVAEGASRFGTEGGLPRLGTFARPLCPAGLSLGIPPAKRPPS